MQMQVDILYVVKIHCMAVNSYSDCNKICAQA